MAGKSPTNQDNNVMEIEAYFERQAQRTAKGWRPDAGTTLRGKVIGLRIGISDYKSAENPDGSYPIVVYKVLDMFKRDGSKVDYPDTVALHVFHKVLRERLAEIGTDMDSEQFVTYIGEVPHNSEKDPKTGEPKTYHMYDAENVGSAEMSGKQEGFTFG